jgi:hypothetical protein
MSESLSRLWLPLYVLALVALMGITTALALASHGRLISCLRSNHHVLWLDLGAPKLWNVALSGGVFTWSPLRGGYLGWLSINGYRDIHDDKIARLGRRLELLRRASIALAVIGVGGLVALYLDHKQVG